MKCLLVNIYNDIEKLRREKLLREKLLIIYRVIQKSNQNAIDKMKQMTITIIMTIMTKWIRSDLNSNKSGSKWNTKHLNNKETKLYQQKIQELNSFMNYLQAHKMFTYGS